MGSGSRPAFGNAKPMRGGNPSQESGPEGGEQFPPVPNDGDASSRQDAPAVPSPAPSPSANRHASAMSRLDERSNAVHVREEVTGFEASVHKIKEQV
ncbi:MAG TPA: flagellar protein FlaI, partial [Erythrobacter sp.]|nr:flagellar protein FlaI [Erythrobacter sp.]